MSPATEHRKKLEKSLGFHPAQRVHAHPTQTSNPMKMTASRKPKRVKEFFLASLLVRLPGRRGRHAWRREVLRAKTPQALVRLIDGRKHFAYASNGVEVIRIELIGAGRDVLAPIAQGAHVEPLDALLARIDANPTGLVW